LYFVLITSTLAHNSTTSFTDRSTRPQYVLIPFSVRSDRNCEHVLVRPIKTRQVSASPYSSLTLQASKKIPKHASKPLRKNRSAHAAHPRRAHNALKDPTALPQRPQSARCVNAKPRRCLCAYSNDRRVVVLYAIAQRTSDRDGTLLRGKTLDCEFDFSSTKSRYVLVITRKNVPVFRCYTLGTLKNLVCHV